MLVCLPATVLLSFNVIVPQLFSFVPASAPAAGCQNSLSTASQGFCSFTNVDLDHVDGVDVRINANQIDTGNNATGMNLTGWNTADKAFQNFVPAIGSTNTISAISNSAGVTTVTMTGSNPFPTSSQSSICIWNASVAAYINCFQLTGVSYTGNFLTSMTFNQGGSPASCSSNCGGAVVTFACGRLLHGSPAPCKVGIIVAHHRNVVSSVADYIYDQPWANSSAYTRQNSTRYYMDQTIKVGTHYYHVVPTLDTQGGGVTAASNPGNWSTTGGTSLDGTVTWQDDGTSAMPQQALVGAGYVGGGNDPTSYAAGGAVFNINTSVGAGVGQCTPSACVPNDVGQGFPLFWQNPYREWIRKFNTTQNDGNGNKGVIPHYQSVPWASQISYIRLGMDDSGEVFFFLQTVVINASWKNLTFNQFLNIHIDSYVADIANSNWQAMVAVSAPYRLDGPTNCYANGNNDNNCLPYFTEIVKVYKAASSAYGFGNQGWYYPDTLTEVNGLWSSQLTGSEFPMFDKYFNNDLASGSTRHLQPQAPDCPVAASNIGTATVTNGQPTITSTAGQGFVTGTSWNGIQIAFITAANTFPTLTISTVTDSSHLTLTTNWTQASGSVQYTAGVDCSNPEEGSFAQFEQLGAQHGINVVEFFAPTVSCTWDSTYTHANGLASGLVEYAECQTDKYQNYYNALASGLPNQTSGINGAGGINQSAGHQ